MLTVRLGSLIIVFVAAAIGGCATVDTGVATDVRDGGSVSASPAGETGAPPHTLEAP